MSAASAVQRGRRAAEALMRDTVTVTRWSAGTLNTSTGLVSNPAPAVVADDVPCRVRVPTTTEATSLFGEEQVTHTRYVACIPHDAGDGIVVNDVIEVTAADACELLGRRFRVLAVPAWTFSMYRTLPCELVE